MKNFATIIGIILLIPLAVVIIGLIIVTLVGGYVFTILSALWEVVITVVAVIIAYKIIMYFIHK